MYGNEGFFSSVYERIASLGENVLRALRMFLSSVFMKPPVFLFMCLRRFMRLLFRGTVMLFAPPDAASGTFADEATRAAKRCIRTLFTEPGAFFPLIKFYLKKVTSRYHFGMSAAVMWIIPVVTLIAVAVGAGIISDKNLALEIVSDGEILGYTASETDFFEAKSMAKEMLSLADSDTVEFPGITYSLTLADAGEFTDTETLCRNILEKTSADTVNACGVYADGKLVSVLYSEGDARNVLERLLAEKKSSEENYVVSFAEDIVYKTGLYPAGSVSTVAEFSKKVTPDKNGKGLFTFKEVKTEVTSVSVPYETVEIKSEALYSGSQRVLSSGKNGYAQVTNFVTYVDGKKTGTSEVARLTVSEPVPERLQIGTKPLDEAYSNSMGGIFLWPIVGAYGINSDYGYRWGKLHAGLDLGMGNAPGTSLGKNIIAVAQGVVQVAAVHSSYGYYLIIDHGNGLQTLYAHCLADSFMVSPGQVVVAGQPIARVGSTGYSTGPHLHFEVRVNGNRVNPRPYLGI